MPIVKHRSTAIGTRDRTSEKAAIFSCSGFVDEHRRLTETRQGAGVSAMAVSLVSRHREQTSIIAPVSQTKTGHLDVRVS